MNWKGEEHETLSLMSHQDGVPPSMIADNSKEQVLGDFKCKLREADCHLKQIKPFSPWMQATEGCIHELKRGVTIKMIQTGLPKQLWDHCVEFQAFISSCTTNNIYRTNGQVPKTIMTRNTANISNICQFGWYTGLCFMLAFPASLTTRPELDDILDPLPTLSQC